MLKLIFKSKNNEAGSVENSIRRLDGQYARMAIELEKLSNLTEKIEKIDSRLRKVENILPKGGFEFQTHIVSSRTKEAIKLILKKHGELTSSQLSKLINLSRTRCNEYLKEMELEGLLTSKINCRKKFYKLRQ